eukprot:TRINITY_DN3386_c0_g1_i1.p3 TRINITY_DN3386_c0_g1~~TRINITY_DN3386_c0_g1_i1.p3  ORF type:complete len:109 (-),score=32.81 TRINITY_DN3386_c0_g1_i1:367-693(-)
MPPGRMGQRTPKPSHHLSRIRQDARSGVLSIFIQYGNGRARAARKRNQPPMAVRMKSSRVSPSDSPMRRSTSLPPENSRNVGVPLTMNRCMAVSMQSVSQRQQRSRSA